MKESAIYSGYVRHRRFQPKIHKFHYKTFMYFFDISEIQKTFSPIKYCSIERFNWQTFRRKDYLDKNNEALDIALRHLINKENGFYPEGEIYLLTQLACFGYCFNPISIYLVFNQDSSNIAAIVLEVTNTPWGERHHYILSEEKNNKKNVRHYIFKKSLHVSPFMEMDYAYHLYFKLTNDKIILHMENKKNNQTYFDATLFLKRLVFNQFTVRDTLFRNPFSQYKISLAIYWQALKLFLKRVPFYSHPKKAKE